MSVSLHAKSIMFIVTKESARANLVKARIWSLNAPAQVVPEGVRQARLPGGFGHAAESTLVPALWSGWLGIIAWPSPDVGAILVRADM